MTTGPTSHFLLVDHLDDHRLDVGHFGQDADTAAAAYSAREHEHRDDPRTEVVLVGADSLETVRKTHSHYFAYTDDLMAAVERDVVATSAAR